MDYAQMGRMGAGAMGGMGQAMMSKNFRSTYDAGRAGGYRDLMENQQIGLFGRTGRTNPNDPNDTFRQGVMDAENFKAWRTGAHRMRPPSMAPSAPTAQGGFGS